MRSVALNFHTKCPFIQFIHSFIHSILLSSVLSFSVSVVPAGRCQDLPHVLTCSVCPRGQVRQLCPGSLVHHKISFFSQSVWNLEARNPPFLLVLQKFLLICSSSSNFDAGWKGRGDTPPWLSPPFSVRCDPSEENFDTERWCCAGCLLYNTCLCLRLSASRVEPISAERSFGFRVLCWRENPFEAVSFGDRIFFCGTALHIDVAHKAELSTTRNLRIYVTFHKECFSHLRQTDVSRRKTCHRCPVHKTSANAPTSDVLPDLFSLDRKPTFICLQELHFDL